MLEGAVLLAAVGGGAVGFALNSSRCREIFFRLRHVKSAALFKERMKLVFVVRQDLGMTQGKVASQCAHAAVACYRKAQYESPQILEAWIYAGQPKIVLKCNKAGDSGLQMYAKDARHLGIVSEEIRDAGHTQVAKGTLTVIGIGPGPESLINKVTAHLKVL